MSEDENREDNLGVLGTVFLGVSTAKILDFLLSYREFDYSEADIARYSQVSTRQVYRALPVLLSMGLTYRTRISGRSKMYKLNTNSPMIQYLEKLVHSLAQVKDVPIQQTIDEEKKELTISS